MLLGTLGASLLGNLLTEKGVNKKGKGTNRACEGIVRAGYGNKNNKTDFLIPPHPSTNFEIQKYYESESKFSGDYSRDNLSNKIKDGQYMINLDEYSDIGTHWIALYVKNNDIAYFDSFGVEHIPEEIKKFINGSLSITTNIFGIQTYDSTMCGYFSIGFINFMLACKTLIDFTNLFSPNDFKTNDDIILKHFMNNACV